MTRAEALQIAKPILFNTEMVQAILDRRKTVTRRAAKILLGVRKCSHEGEHEFILDNSAERKTPTGFVCKKCGLGVYPPNSRHLWIVPPCFPGDVLYVRETWHPIDLISAQDFVYKADDPLGSNKWCPSVNMPKEAARILLRVTEVRLERLQDIDGYGILAEGVE